MTTQPTERRRIAALDEWQQIAGIAQAHGMGAVVEKCAPPPCATQKQVETATKQLEAKLKEAK